MVAAGIEGGLHADDDAVNRLQMKEALRKMEAEIRYWLEMCPCSGETYRDLEIEV